MNHFLDKKTQSALDPVSMDSQKSIWWNVPLKILYRRTTESGGNGNNIVIDVDMLPRWGMLNSLSLFRLEWRHSTENYDIGGDQQEISLTASVI